MPKSLADQLGHDPSAEEHFAYLEKRLAALERKIRKMAGDIDDDEPAEKK